MAQLGFFNLSDRYASLDSKRNTLVAYWSKEMETRLRALKLKSHIHHKGNRSKPLTEQAKGSNRTKSSVRAG